jgi:hypothetical protein
VKEEEKRYEWVKPQHNECYEITVKEEEKRYEGVKPQHNEYYEMMVREGNEVYGYGNLKTMSLVKMRAIITCPCLKQRRPFVCLTNQGNSQTRSAQHKNIILKAYH